MVEGAILHSGAKSGMVGGIGAGILLSFAWVTGMLLPRGGWLFVAIRKYHRRLFCWGYGESGFRGVAIRNAESQAMG
jgi:hypothetical protein